MIKLLGKYELHEQLGKGGFGTVYRATDSVLGVDRALKVLHPALVADETFIFRFKQEAQIAARLEHPNLVPVYDFGETEGRYYLAMKYMPGGSLKDLLAREGKLDQERSLEILRQVAEGIGFAHEHNIIHRDLKPGNILFDQDGAVRVSDMGFAKALAQGNSASLSATGGMVGTPSYMAPEIWRGKPALPASDIYSLGCILYEMLTGKVLFEGESPADVMTKHVLDGPKLIEVLPGVIATILAKALAKDPEDRFDNARGFIDAINRINQTTKKNEEVVPEEILSTEIPVDDSSVSPEKEIVGTQASEKITEQEKIKDVRQQNIEPSALPLKYVSPYNQSREEGQPQSNTWKWMVLALIVIGGIVGLIVTIINQSNQRTAAEIARSNNTATAAVKATNTAIAEREASINEFESISYLLIGPESGSLEHKIDGYVETHFLVNMIRDFILEVTFINPYDASANGWDFGVLFRGYGVNNQYRLIVESDKTWKLRNNVGDSSVIVTSGRLENLDISDGASNKLKLIVIGNKGYFYLNDDFISELNLTEINFSGELEIGVGFIHGNEMDGEVTNFQNLTVMTYYDNEINGATDTVKANRTATSIANRTETAMTNATSTAITRMTATAITNTTSTAIAQGSSSCTIPWREVEFNSNSIEYFEDHLTLQTLLYNQNNNWPADKYYSYIYPPPEGCSVGSHYCRVEGLALRCYTDLYSSTSATTCRFVFDINGEKCGHVYGITYNAKFP